MVDGQHLPGSTVATTRSPRLIAATAPIQQLTDRCTTPKAGVAVSRGTVRTVAQVDIVSSPVGTLCCIVQAIVHARNLSVAVPTFECACGAAN
jgi:hypothetical protein